MIEKFLNILPRVFFIVAFLCIAIAIVDWTLRLFGWTFTFIPYQPGRMFEFSGIFVLFVITLVVRQIREILKVKNS